MKVKRMIAVVLSGAVMVSSLLTGCGSKQAGSGESTQSQSGDKAGSKVVLKLNSVQSNNDPSYAAFMELADNVKKRSNDTLEIQVYANSELGSNKDNIEQAMRGTDIIAVGDAGFMADYVPDYGVMNGPFLYNSYEDLKKLAASPWHKEMMDASSKKGIKVLAMDWYFGARHIISDKVIKTPEDMKGMKVRVPSNTMWIETIKAMGGSPTTLQWSEVYSGLSQKVVDAAEAPLSTIYTSKLQEVKKHISLTNHFTGIIGLEMSQKVFDSLSEDNKKILSEEVKTVGEKYSEGVLKSEDEWRKKLEAEGVTFNEVDTDAFKKATAAVYTKFSTWTPGLYDRVLKEMGK